MKLPTSPCLSCTHAAICPDSWYECVAWSTYFYANWPVATKAYKRCDQLLRLYRSGKNDREIGESVGVSPLTVFNWRKRNGLPPVGKRGPKHSPVAPSHIPEG